jgi:hypothetical protein
MWPGRYDIDVGPPPNQGWIKTNTLEGGHGWDYWLHEGWEGYDNEFLVGAELFPFAIAGYIKTTNNIPTHRGENLILESEKVNLTGTVHAASPWYGNIMTVYSVKIMSIFC